MGTVRGVLPGPPSGPVFSLILLAAASRLMGPSGDLFRGRQGESSSTSAYARALRRRRYRAQGQAGSLLQRLPRKGLDSTACASRQPLRARRWEVRPPPGPAVGHPVGEADPAGEVRRRHVHERAVPAQEQLADHWSAARAEPEMPTAGFARALGPRAVAGPRMSCARAGGRVSPPKVGAGPGGWT
jgi:hypothetical protein